MTRSRFPKTLAIAAIVFGALTVASGGSALFGDATVRAELGHVVDYVLWFNFVAGFAYVAAGIGLWRARRWGAWLAAVLALATAAVAIAFGWHVAGGGAYEMRTVGALVLRLGFWAAVSVVAWRSLGRPRARAPSALG